MSAAAAYSPFCLVAADFQSAEWTLQRLTELNELVRVGELHPLPLTSFRFETAEMVRAFNELRRGDHIGRYVATVADKLPRSDTSVARLGRLPASLEGCMVAIGASDQRQGRLQTMCALVQLCRDAATAILQLDDGFFHVAVHQCHALSTHQRVPKKTAVKKPVQCIEKTT